jgi:diadenosine tetraphosphate (Ap4A) HIT family hydrolase
MTFELDPRLDNDCFKLAESEHSLWLLMNNRLFTWMVIVPKTQQTELYLLSEKEQLLLTKQSNLLSEFIQQYFDCDKLNVACIGNIVKQMHLHVIARTTSDPCWPGIVWGTSFKEPYKNEQVLKIQQQLQAFCEHKKTTEFKFLALQDKG